jgi:hypothetical protein
MGMVLPFSLIFIFPKEILGQPWEKYSFWHDKEVKSSQGIAEKWITLSSQSSVNNRL